MARISFLALMNEDTAYCLGLCEKKKSEIFMILVIQSGHVEAVQLTFFMCIQTNKMQFMSTH